MTSPSPARPKTTPSSLKLSAGRVVKKYQRLRARSSPLNDKVKRRLLAKLGQSSMSNTNEMNAGKCYRLSYRCILVSFCSSSSIITIL